MKTKILSIISAVVILASCNCGGNKEGATCNKGNDAAACTAEMKKIIGAQAFIKPEKVSDFIAQAQDVIRGSRAEAGNISYTLYQDPSDSTKFFFFEEWKNQAAIDTHFATEHFIAFGSVLEGCSSSPAIITVYDSPSQK